MRLEDYLKERSSSLLRWCRENKLPYFSIRYILRGGDCYLSTAIQIEEATKGKVKCKDLKPIKPKPAQERLRRLTTKMNVKEKTDGYDSENSHA